VTSRRGRSGLKSFPRRAPTATPGLQLEHRLDELCFRQRPPLLRRSLRLEPGVLFLKLTEPFGLFCIHSTVELPPAVVGGLGDFENSAGVRNCLALSKQLVSRFELADDLFGYVPGAFHGGVPGPVWPDEDSHSPWTDFWGPRHSVNNYKCGRCQKSNIQKQC